LSIERCRGDHWRQLTKAPTMRTNIDVTVLLPENRKRKKDNVDKIFTRNVRNTDCILKSAARLNHNYHIVLNQ